MNNTEHCKYYEDKPGEFKWSCAIMGHDWFKCGEMVVFHYKHTCVNCGRIEWREEQ